MKALVKRIFAGVLVLAICSGNGSFVYASAAEDKKSPLSAVGEWFGDRASDVQNAAVVAVDSTGRWFVNRGQDICEITAVVGNWTSDRYEDVQILVTNTGEMIVCAASNFDPSKLTTKEYYLDSGEKLLLGDYSEKDPTALSMGLNLAASVVNVDIGMDIRDLAYDVQYYGEEEIELSDLAIDAVAVLPVIGFVKPLKHIGDAAESVKIVSEMADTASDVSKNLDSISDVADSVHDIEKTVDVVDDIADAGKEFSKIPVKDLPEKVQETYKTYEDCGWDAPKALENMADGTDAGRVWLNREGDLPEFDAAHNELSYIEYDAYSFGDDPNPLKEGWRGPSRFLRDNNGKVYYTDDHYDSFRVIIESLED